MNRNKTWNKQHDCTITFDEEAQIVECEEMEVPVVLKLRKFDEIADNDRNMDIMAVIVD